MHLVVTAFAVYLLISISIVVSVQGSGLSVKQKSASADPIKIEAFSDFLKKKLSEDEVIEGITKYIPTWESLDSRPLPTWYDQAKVGIFVNWGVYSVPAYNNEWFWWDWQGDNVTARNPDVIDFMKRNYPPNFTYQNFATQFTAELFNATEWGELFKKSGAKYVVFSSKHHEGFTNWPSKYSFGWNSMDVGPKRDLVGELAEGIRKNSNLRFGLYHSLTEWFNPLLLADKASNWTTNFFVQFKTMPELYELVENYQPDVVWSDGEWGGDSDYWESRKFLAWLYNDSPVKNSVVTNDRWGTETTCRHGGFYSCADRFNPGVLQPHKWENRMTIDRKSWGFRRNAKIQDYLTAGELIKTLVESVACGGNILINVGPTKEGVISPIEQERLLQLGQWLELNGEAIYNSVPWIFQNDSATPGVWYTSNPSNGKIYAFVTNFQSRPFPTELYLESVDPDLLGLRIGTWIELRGYGQPFIWRSASPKRGIRIIIPPLILKDISKWTRTFVITTY